MPLTILDFMLRKFSICLPAPCFIIQSYWWQNYVVTLSKCVVDPLAAQAVFELTLLTEKYERKSCTWCLLQSNPSLSSWTPFSYMNCLKSNRKVGYRHVVFNLTYHWYLQSFTKFVQKVCFALRERDQKNTQYLSKENHC